MIYFRRWTQCGWYLKIRNLNISSIEMLIFIRLLLLCSNYHLTIRWHARQLMDSQNMDKALCLVIDLGEVGHLSLSESGFLSI